MSLKIRKTQTIPFELLRHSDAECYVQEGFGGKPIEVWPVYSFFEQHLTGDQSVARKAFVDWYNEQLEKYHNVPNIKGGMFRGSLYRLIEEKGGSFENVDASTKETAIRERVDQRFKLLEDIQLHGYREELSEPIEAIKKNGLIYLNGGHHRAAALRVLGKNALPGVFVFPNQILYNTYCLLRKIRHGAI